MVTCNLKLEIFIEPSALKTLSKEYVYCWINGKFAHIRRHGQSSWDRCKWTYRIKWPNKRQQVLRGGNFDSWTANHGASGHTLRDATYLRDAWMMSTLKAMNHLVPDSFFYALYINDRRRGLYHVIDRPTRQWAVDMLNVKNVSLIKAAKPPRVIIRTYGKLKLWRQVRNCERYSEFEKLLDLDKWIEYLIVNQYAQNQDWPGSNWAIVGSPTKRLVPITWDAELSLGDFRKQTKLTWSYGDGLAHVLSILKYDRKFIERYNAKVESLLAGALSERACEERWDLLVLAVEPMIGVEAQMLSQSIHMWELAIQRVREFFKNRALHFRQALKAEL